jgi:hypothetical protein
MPASPFESRVPLEVSSPNNSSAQWVLVPRKDGSSANPRVRRSARRWAAPLDVPGTQRDATAREPERQDRREREANEDSDLARPKSGKPREEHAIEAMVRALLDPPDIETRVKDYDW